MKEKNGDKDKDEGNVIKTDAKTKRMRGKWKTDRKKEK